MLGLSINTIAVGKWDFVWMPIGIRDSTMAGGRVWVRVRMQAIEAIREQREIIVCNDQLGIKEHTPVELSYQTTAGPYQRVTEVYPLPVTFGQHTKWGSYEYTAAATRSDIASLLSSPHSLTPTSGYTLIIENILLFADAASDVTIEGGDGTTYYAIYKAYLGAGGGSNIFNLGVKLRNTTDKIYVTVTAANTSITIVCREII